MKKIQVLYLKMIGAGYLMLCSLLSFAQVGIDNTNPNPYAILDLKASDKGLLVPRMTSSERFSLKTSCSPSCPNGLMVYDTDLNGFFYLSSNTWYLINPFVAPDGTNAVAEDMNTLTTVVADVGIGVSPAAGYKLDVNGKSNLRSGADVGATLTVTSGNAVISTGNVSAPAGNITTTSGNITTTSGKITASGFSSDLTATNVAGPVPKGGIVMWSGSVASIPSGWALCNGSNGTPDLRDKFIVGAGNSYAVAATGGANTVTLTTAQMPSHSHTGSTGNDGAHSHTINHSMADYAGSWTSNAYVVSNPAHRNNGSFTESTQTDGSHSHTITLNAEGGGGAHENRPPYYALAYIMKL